MDPDKIPFLLRQIGEQLENRLSDAMDKRPKKNDEKKSSAKAERTAMPPMRNDNMEYMEPDWDDIDKKADMIVARYSVVSAAMNILPMPFDVMGVTGTFSKMATELAGVYQVIVSNKRARQMGWAIASTTASVLGLAYAGSKLAKLIPGGYWIATAAQAPLVGAISWAAGDALKNYFKQCRQGKEPSIASLSESFSDTLRLKLKRTKKSDNVTETLPTTTTATTTAPPVTTPSDSGTIGDAVEKIAGLHELLRAGAITQADYDAKKADLLSKM